MFSNFQFFILSVDVICLLHFIWSPNTARVSTSPTSVTQGWEERSVTHYDIRIVDIFASREVLSNHQRKVTVYRGLHSPCKWEGLDGTSIHEFICGYTIREFAYKTEYGHKIKPHQNPTLSGHVAPWFGMKYFFSDVRPVENAMEMLKRSPKGIPGYVNYDQT